MKKVMAVSIYEELIEELRKEAKDLKISFSSYVTLIFIKREKKNG